MIVCKQCLQAIESHEGHQIQRKLSPLDDENLSKTDTEMTMANMCIVNGARSMCRLMKIMKYKGD